MLLGDNKFKGYISKFRDIASMDYSSRNKSMSVSL